MSPPTERAPSRASCGAVEGASWARSVKRQRPLNFSPDCGANRARFGGRMLVHLAIAQQGHVQDPSAEATAEFAAAAPGTAIDWMRRLTAAPAARFWHSGSYQWASRHHEQTRAVLNRAASGEVITIATVGGSSSAQQTNYGHHLATGLRTLLHEAGYLNASIRVINPSQVRRCPRACVLLWSVITN